MAGEGKPLVTLEDLRAALAASLDGGEGDAVLLAGLCIAQAHAIVALQAQIETLQEIVRQGPAITVTHAAPPPPAPLPPFSLFLLN